MWKVAVISLCFILNAWLGAVGWRRVDELTRALTEERQAHDFTRKTAIYEKQLCQRDLVSCRFFREIGPTLDD